MRWKSALTGVSVLGGLGGLAVGLAAGWVIDAVIEKWRLERRPGA